MSKKFVWVILLAIVMLGGILRFWQLGHVPISPDWDEVALGYNAYSILHTGRDEFGKFLPIVLQSYGDYKPALYAYLIIPSVALFGLSVFAVRLPSALFGILTVFLTYFLIKELFKRRDIALIGSLLLAISPWHIQFSRVAFETNVGLSLNVLGAVLFLKALKRPWVLPLSIGIFALGPYVYQSEKVFTPLLLLLLVSIFFKQIVALPKKLLVTSCVIGIIILSPVAAYTVFGAGGLARAEGVSIFSSSTLNTTITNRYLYNTSHHDSISLLLENKRLVYAKTILANYLSHFDLNWLFITGDINRHHAPDMGLLYIWELPFLLIGIYQLLFGPYSKKTKLFVFGWYLLAPLPASITNDVPHAVRTMNFLPMYQIFTSLGVVTAIGFLKNRSINKIPYGLFLLGLISLFALFNFVYYLDQYFVQQNYFYATDWQYGYAQAVEKTTQLAPSYSQVIVENRTPMDESYMFFLFYQKYDPKIYQKEGVSSASQIHHFGKYTFEPIDWAKDAHMTHTLFVGIPSDFPSTVSGIKKIIYNVDGKPIMEIIGN